MIQYLFLLIVCDKKDRFADRQFEKKRQTQDIKKKRIKI